VYDSPLHIRDLSSLKNSCNRIFFFDRGQVEEHKKDGVNAMHLPLAVDTEVFYINASGREKAEEHKKNGVNTRHLWREEYRTDVSLVGKLYQTEYAYFTAPLQEYVKGYLEGIVNSQGKIYGGYLIPELISDELLARMNEDYAKAASDGFQMGRRELEFMLACETTGRERYTALALLSSHFPVDLYSTDEDKRLEKVRFRGYADYYSQMPLVFSQSRVNLNISLKTIRTGIPLRVIDVLGCGGFVLSNYQEELFEYFQVGEELVVYENIEDLFYKTKYYLEHEEERRQIAQAGLARVKRDFTFRDRIDRMFPKQS
jgi:spore maturation protein CgeB